MRLTLGGFLFCLGALLVGLAAIDSELNLLLILFGLCTGSILINAVFGWRTLRSLSVSRNAPDFAIAGQPMEFRYTLTNHRFWATARGIQIREATAQRTQVTLPEAFAVQVRPGRSENLTAPAMSQRRGRVRLTGIRVETSFPFGIFTKSVFHASAHEIDIYPALGRLATAVPATARAADAVGGGTASSRRKGDEEYYGIREYRAGDNPRRIHWRRSAQMGRLMIREMAQTRDPQLWCMVDTRVAPRDAKQADALEAAISAAATVLCDRLERGGRIGLICGGDPLVVLPPAAGRPRRTRLLRELARRTTNTTLPLCEQIERLGWPTRWRGACLLFGAVPDERLRRAANILARGVGPVTILTPGSEDFERLFVRGSLEILPASGGAIERQVNADPPGGIAA